MKFPSITRRLALLFFVVVFSQAPIAGADKTYEAQLAEARRFDDEKSWALARDAYGAALKLAPDDEAKRWCELWQARAEWRAKGPKNWSVQHNFDEKLNEWISPYQTNERDSGANVAGKNAVRAKDEFWLGIVECCMEARLEHSERGKLWDLRRETLDYLASATPSEKANARLMAFVRGMNYFRNSSSSDEPEAKARFAEVLGHIAHAGVLPREDRAWCALASYGLSEPDIAARHMRVLATLCADTRYEAAANALIFSKEMRCRDAKTILNAVTANREILRDGYAGLLERATQLRAKLPKKTQDHVFLAATDALNDLIGQWKFPYLRGHMASTFGTADRVQFSVGTARVRNIKADLHSYDLTTYRALLEMEAGLDKLQGTALLEKYRAVPGVRLLRSMPLFVSPPEDSFAWQSEVFHLEQPLEPGFYMLALSGDYGDGETVAKLCHFVVSDVRVVGMTSSNAMIDLYVLNKHDGAPVANAEVNMDAYASKWQHSRNGDSRIVQSWTGRTDADGHLRLAASSKENDFATIVAGGHPVVTRYLRTHVRNYQDDTKFVADLFLDRPLYRPGETVHWKIIARERKEGRFDVCSLPATVSASTINAEFLKDEPIKFNSFGTAHGKFVIPESTRPGDARWRLKLGDKDAHLRGSFGVDNFTPPAMRASIELASSSESVRPGQEMTVRFSARYYSGGAVVGAPVECTIRPDFDRFDYSEGSEAAHREYEEWKMSQGRRLLHGVTNADGEAEFLLSLPKTVPAGTILYVLAEAKPEGMPDIRAEAGFCVSETGVFANPRTETHPRLVGPSKENVFCFDMADAAGKPCAFE
ncbi:MG2 domain-containing protein [Ereboglobus luteus]|uniref:Macroglobulin domain-containing protein n=1 Tax=Ereboglobus luteus TaxID=1796921 RepID=A0A2U8E5G4_9BACT|nr:MG2 domain-containing protein [Ereboglobus luteus]AWI10091.1 hypothetical protein CKA38_13240 [Ereboglobus luteus]